MKNSASGQQQGISGLVSSRFLVGFVAAAFLSTVLPAIGAATTQPISQRPNILFIITDDVGYGDLSCYGATKVKTPNIDKLAKDGCRFTDAHSPAATCTPTRRALLTGVYSWRQKPGSSIARGDAPLSIPPGSVTLPSVLKSAGYNTGIVGKWHLGLGGPGGPDWNGDIKPGPLELGFDHAFYMPGTGDRTPTVYIQNHRVVGLDPADPIQVSYDKKIGNEPTGRENPELLTLKATHGHDNTIINGIGRIGWMSGGHKARWKDEEMADTFTTHGVQFLEKAGFAPNKKGAPFFLYFSTHNIHVPRVPHPRFRGKSGLGARGDAILELDDNVGTILATLDRLGLRENTLVIFTSDNGGKHGDGYEDFVPGDHQPNGPLRSTKGTLFEGGHRVPFIVRWPGQVKPGAESKAILCYIDALASLASLVQQPVPAGAAKDSRNTLQQLLGKAASAPDTEYVFHSGGTDGPFALRRGDWKLVQQPAPGQRKKTYNPDDEITSSSGPLLFNLANDIGEKNNLANEHPEKVAELEARLKQIREQ